MTEKSWIEKEIEENNISSDEYINTLELEIEKLNNRISDIIEKNFEKIDGMDLIEIIKKRIDSSYDKEYSIFDSIDLAEKKGPSKEMTDIIKNMDKLLKKDHKISMMDRECFLHFKWYVENYLEDRRNIAKIMTNEIREQQNNDYCRHAMLEMIDNMKRMTTYWEDEDE